MCVKSFSLREQVRESKYRKRQERKVGRTQNEKSCFVDMFGSWEMVEEEIECCGIYLISCKDRMTSFVSQMNNNSRNRNTYVSCN